MIKTPSGYEVYLKENFTYGDYRKIVKSFLKSSELNFGDPTNQKVEFKTTTADKLLDYEEFATDLLIEKIVKNGNVIITDFKKEIDSWSIEDGEVVYNEIRRLLNEVMNKGKKK